MIQKIIYVILSIIVIYLILCLVGPKKIEVNVSRDIDATPAAIYSQIADLRNMKNWSKWIIEDTSIKLSYQHKTTDIGGEYSWESEKSGSGKMKITDEELNKFVKYELSFKDWDAISDVEIQLIPKDGNHTNTNWTMKDRKEFPFMMRGMMLVMNMNGKIKKDFEKGLENLNNYLLANPSVLLIKNFNINQNEFTAINYLGKRSIVKFSEMQNYFATHFIEIEKLAGKSIAGIPVGLFWKYDEKSMTSDMAAAIPVNNTQLNNNEYSIIAVPTSKQFTLDYYGSYSNMKTAYNTLDSLIKMNGYSQPSLVIEEYMTDPMTEKDTTNWLTKIHFLVK